MTLTTKEAGLLLKKSPEQVRYLIRTGRLDALRTRGRWWLKREDVATALLEGLPKPLPQQHDRTARHLFSHPRVIEDLFQGFSDDLWVANLDFSTLKKVSEGFVSDRLDARWADMVWQMKWRGTDMDVYLLLEFQSSIEPYMAVRWLPILGSFFQDQIRQLALPVGDVKNRPPLLPMVLAMVVYSGKPPWWPPSELHKQIACPPGMESAIPVNVCYSILDMGRVPEGRLKDMGQNMVAALVRLERAETPPELGAQWSDIENWLPTAIQPSFQLWLLAALRRMGFSGLDVLEGEDDDREMTMIVENMREYMRKSVQEAEQEGRIHGLILGRSEGRVEERLDLVLRQAEVKFGSLDAATRRRIESAKPSTLLAWSDRLLKASTLAEVFEDA